ncbi:MAG: hypothetical protein RIQ55_361 [Pseudomonadota bacterium]|jgi:uncharacterized membrane protein
MLDIEKRLVAVASISFMLVASCALLFDRLIIAYAISLMYAVVRWKFAENGEMLVSNSFAKWALRCFVAICCVLFAAGGSAFGEGFRKYELVPGIMAFVGFAFAYDIGRFFGKVNVKGAL